MNKKLSTIAVLGFMLISSAGYSEPGVNDTNFTESKFPKTRHQHNDPEFGAKGISLSPALKTLLIQEMQAMQKGITLLAPAIVTGSWSEIESIGTMMKKGYILKQKLTAQQASELKHSLPGFFKQLDHTLHTSAGMMANAAKEKNSLLVSFYYSNMVDACIGCHTKYATKRFPSFLDDANQSTSMKHLSEASTSHH